MSQYWDARALARQGVYDKAGDAAMRIVKNAYDAAAKQLRTDARAILGGFGKAFHLSENEARALLGEKVTPQVEAKLRKAWAALPENVRNAMADAPAYRARLNRLEALTLSAKTNIGRVAALEIDTTEQGLLALANDAYNRAMFDVQTAAGFSFPTAGMSVGRAQAILTDDWSGASISARVWESARDAAEKCAQALEECAIAGKTSTQTYRELCALARDGEMSANRLLRTEWSNIANRAETAAYRDANIKQYRYCAVLDLRTSEVCQLLDGKIFDLDKAKTGVNLPPLHPYCRSTTAPVVTGSVTAENKRFARDPVTGKTTYMPEGTTYADWMKAQEEKYEADALRVQKTKIHNAKADTQEMRLYQTVLGKRKAPSGIDAFQGIKYGNSAAWTQLQKDYAQAVRKARSTR